MTTAEPVGLSREEWLAWARDEQIEAEGGEAIGEAQLGVLWDAAQRSAAADVVALLRAGATEQRHTSGLARAAELVARRYELELTAAAPPVSHVVQLGMSTDLTGMWTCTCGQSEHGLHRKALQLERAHLHADAHGGMVRE